MTECVTVTFGVIAYNEQKYLPDLLSDLIRQAYPKNLIEVILVDGGSTDDTWKVMETFKDEYEKVYRDIKILNNPRRIQPAGWNVVIRNFSSDVLLRIDAHARLPEDFIEANIACLNTGENVCGGPRVNIIDENTSWKRMLLAAEQSMFGSGIASYRQGTEEKKYVKSLFHGAYRKEVIQKIGLFNEDLIRTEDNEYHYRIHEVGYKICYDPLIQSSYQTRSSLKKMLIQKYQNGLWIGKTLFICPRCISLFHLVPFAFVMAILITIIMSICGLTWPVAALWIAYGVAEIGMTAMALISEKGINLCSLILPIIFLLLHISYGVGTMKGIFEMIASKVRGG